MTEQIWQRLKVGDMIVNERQPAIVLEVIARREIEAGWVEPKGTEYTIRAPHGEFVLAAFRCSEFAIRCVQEKLPL